MPEWAVILLSAVLGNVVGVATIIANRKKVASEAASIVSEAAGGLVKNMQIRLSSVEKRVRILEQDNRRLIQQVEELRDVLRELWELACEQARELGQPVPPRLGKRVIQALEDGSE